MEHGQRWQRSTLGSVRLFTVVWWTGASASLLGFVAVRWTLLPKRSLTFAITGAIAFMVSASQRMPMRPF